MTSVRKPNVTVMTNYLGILRHNDGSYTIIVDEDDLFAAEALRSAGIFNVSQTNFPAGKYEEAWAKALEIKRAYKSLKARQERQDLFALGVHQLYRT